MKKHCFWRRLVVVVAVAAVAVVVVVCLALGTPAVLLRKQPSWWLTLRPRPSQRRPAR